MYCKPRIRHKTASNKNLLQCEFLLVALRVACNEEMEKRSRRRIRDLMAPMAIQGLSQNEIGCARISMMVQGPDTEAQDQPSPDHHIQLATHGRSIQKYGVNRPNERSVFRQQ